MKSWASKCSCYLQSDTCLESVATCHAPANFWFSATEPQRTEFVLSFTVGVAELQSCWCDPGLQDLCLSWGAPPERQSTSVPLAVWTAVSGHHWPGGKATVIVLHPLEYRSCHSDKPSSWGEDTFLLDTYCG